MNHLKSVAVFSEDWLEIGCVIDEKFNGTKLVTPM